MLVRLSGASYSINNRWLLNDIDLTINKEDKIGIVGRNGSGKSTLLKMLSGELPLHSGKREVHPKVGILTVKQEMPDDDISALEWLKSADLFLRELEAKEESVSDEEFAKLSDQIAAVETERYEVAAPRILTGLGLKQEDWEKPMRQLSGGFRMRISLASALIQEPSLAAPKSYVLLLDEPSNQLDLESIIWLNTFLMSYKNPYVIVSHDRALLNRLTTGTVHVQTGQVKRYKGSFDTFKRQYQLQREQDEQKNKSIGMKQESAQKYIDVWGEHQSTAGLAQSRLKFIAKIEKEKVEIAEEEPEIDISFPKTSMIDGPLIEISGASVGYDKRTVLTDVNFMVQGDSRLGILGRNGQGKSTLVRLLAEKLDVIDGNILHAGSLKIGYFSQDQADELDASLTPAEQMKLILNTDNVSTIRAQLGKFGLGKDDKANCKIGNLSGGEKSRLAFALISARNPQVIILDEPTNHLDMNAQEKLIEAIKGFGGAIIMVSHDWELMAATMKQFLVVSQGKVKELKGSLENYKKELLKAIDKVSKGDIKGMQSILASDAVLVRSLSAPKPAQKAETKEVKNEVKVDAKVGKSFETLGLFPTKSGEVIQGIADGECFGFEASELKSRGASSLNVKREVIVSALLKAIEEEKNQAYLVPEIVSLLLKEKLTHLGNKVLNSCLEVYQDAKVSFETLLDKYNKHYKKKCDGKEMIEFLSRENPGQHQALITEQAKIRIALNDLTSQCSDKIFITKYIKEGLGGTLPVGYRSTILVGQEKGKSDLFFWKMNSKDRSLEICGRCSKLDPKTSLHFLLSADETSFQPITVKSQQKRQTYAP